MGTTLIHAVDQFLLYLSIHFKERAHFFNRFSKAEASSSAECLQSCRASSRARQRTRLCPRPVSRLYSALNLQLTTLGHIQLNSNTKDAVSQRAYTCQRLLSPTPFNSHQNFYILKIAPFLPSSHFFSLSLFFPREPQIVSRFSHIVT